MGEKRIARLIPYEVEYVCDKCGKGYMKPTGRIFATVTPMQIQHKCNNCGDVECFPEEKYPKIIYEREELVK